MRAGTGAKLSAAIATAVLVAVAAVISAVTIRRANAATELTAHSQATIAAVEDLLYDLTVAQNDFSWFLITGQPRYRDAFENVARHVDNDMIELRGIAGANVDHQHHLGSLEALTDRQVEAERNTMRVRSSRGYSAALTTFYGSPAIGNLPRIGAEINAIETTERQGLSAKITEKNAAEQLATIAIALASLAAVALVALLVLIMRRDLRTLTQTAADRDANLAREMIARRRLEAIQSVLDGTLAHLSVENLLSELIGRVAKALGADVATILLLMRDGRRLEVCATNAPIGVQYGFRIPVGTGLVGRIAESRELECIADLADEIDVGNAIPDKLRSLAGLPLIVRDKLIGVIYVGWNERHVCDENEMHLLKLVAARAASAIERARLYEAERRSEEHFRLLVDGVSDHAMFMLGPAGEVKSWNPGARRVFAYDEAEVLGRNFSIFFPPEDRTLSKPEETLALAKETGRAAEEGWRVRADGTRFWGSSVVSVIYDEEADKLIGFANITRDLSEQKHAEQMVLAAKEAAEAANSAKTKFLAMMSHEIRTPLNAISGYTELLELGLKGPINDEQRNYLQRVHASSKHLLGLVNELLDLAKIESGQLKVRREAADLREAVSGTLLLVHPQAHAKKIRMSWPSVMEAPLPYLGDPHRVDQILLNLLSNALKFTPENGSVSVTAGVTTRPDDTARVRAGRPWLFIRITDSGIGIQQNQLDAIFEAFVQVPDPTNPTPGGTGLGLTISRRLARLMGGDLTAQSEPGNGSSFTLWLPALTAQAGADEVQFPERRSTTRTVAGLAAGGTALLSGLQSLTKAHASRVATELVHDSGTQYDHEGHIALLLADLAQTLIAIDQAEGEASSLVRDNADFRRLVSERHGAARARQHWTEDLVSGEFEMLREEIGGFLRMGAGEGESVQVASTTDVVGKLLDQAERSCIRGLQVSTISEDAAAN